MFVPNALGVYQPLFHIFEAIFDPDVNPDLKPLMETWVQNQRIEPAGQCKSWTTGVATQAKPHQSWFRSMFFECHLFKLLLRLPEIRRNRKLVFWSCCGGKTQEVTKMNSSRQDVTRVVVRRHLCACNGVIVPLSHLFPCWHTSSVFYLPGVGRRSGTARWADSAWPPVCWPSKTPSEQSTKKQRYEPMQRKSGSSGALVLLLLLFFTSGWTANRAECRTKRGGPHRRCPASFWKFENSAVGVFSICLLFTVGDLADCQQHLCAPCCACYASHSSSRTHTQKCKAWRALTKDVLMGGWKRWGWFDFEEKKEQVWLLQ